MNGLNGYAWMPRGQWFPASTYRVEKLSEFSYAVVREFDETCVSHHRSLDEARKAAEARA